MSAEHQLDELLAVARTTPAEQLPELIGDLERVKAVALARLTAPQPQPQPDALLDVEEAARRLSMSRDFLYRNADSFPFTRRIGRALRFSSTGITEFAQKKPLAAKR